VLNHLGIMADSSVRTRLAWPGPQWRLSVLALVPLLLLAAAWAQSESEGPSLADLAKKTRAAKASKEHVVARRELNEENAPSAKSEKHTTSYWATIPAAELTVLVPIPNRGRYCGLEVPLKHSEVHLLFGETVWSTSFNTAAQEYLGMLLTRSCFSGAALKLDGVEDTSVGSQRALLVHFNFDFKGIHHAGIALFVSAPEQVLSMGCMYRNADWEQAEPICEDVIRSAEVNVPVEYRLFKKPHN
jgi:hypothetical protein